MTRDEALLALLNPVVKVATSVVTVVPPRRRPS